MKKILSTVFFSVNFLSSHSQLLINEVLVANYENIVDEDNEHGDWIELFNSGSDVITLDEYALSDDAANPEKWILPSLELQPAEHLVVFASGKDRYGEAGVPQHFEVPVYPWSEWGYLVPTEEPDASWRLPAFDDFLWDHASGGIGFGDGDDATEISWPALSLYTRTSFYLDDLSAIELMYLLVDYDDGFVAYLNGVEIIRANIGTEGIPPTFDTPASSEHEANGYQNLPLDFYGFTAQMLDGILLQGENVLAIQTHNVDMLSSDLTSNVLLLLGMNNFAVQTEMAAEWIDLPTANHHANFKLNQGETLLLTHIPNGVQETLLIPSMQMDDSYQRSGDGNALWCFTSQPTPESPNSIDCYVGYAQKPVFVTESGMYESSVTVAIESPDVGAEIYYTLDGSIPDLSSYQYLAPFLLDTTATVSAIAVLGGSLPSDVEKNTFMINEWGVTLPVVSLSTNPENLWDPVTGIHVFGPEDYDTWVPYYGANFWENWERDAYFEYFDANHDLQAEGNVGVKIHGGWSRSNPQKSFRIQCKDQFGLESMDYPMIGDKSFIQSFQGFNLRNGGNDYYDYRFHDALMQRAFKGTHADYMAYTPVVVFLNGEYWGFMEMREILDENWVEGNKGIDKNEVSVLGMNYSDFNIINGSDSSFYPMYNYILSEEPNSEHFLDSLNTMLDLDNYMDYIIAETYWANGDWSNGWINNTKLWHDDRPGGRWRFMLMDMDFGMGLSGSSPFDDFINTAEDEPYFTDMMFARIIQNDQFRINFINRYADLINTNLKEEKIMDLAFAMRDEIINDFPRHCQTWSTNCDAPFGALNERIAWGTLRVQGARDVIENHYELEGQVDITLNVYPAGAGRIHISTIEPLEVEYPWSGVYFKGVPVKLTVIANPGYVFDHWAQNSYFPDFSNLDQVELLFTGNEVFTAYFIGAPASDALLVSEFMYHDAAAADGGDWIELHNNLDVPLDLSGYYLKDSDYFNRYDLGLNTIIPANGYLVLTESESQFLNQYPQLQSAGSFNFSLSNSADEIHVYDRHHNAIVSINYQDSNPWPVNTDGTGRSVEYIGDDMAQDLPENWTDGCIHGSPTVAFDPNCGLIFVHEETDERTFAIYPVPANDHLLVRIDADLLSENPYLQLMDASGKIVLQSKMTNSSTNFDIHNIAAGVYVVRIKHNSGILHKTLLKR